MPDVGAVLHLQHCVQAGAFASAATQMCGLKWMRGTFAWVWVQFFICNTQCRAEGLG